LRTPGDLNFVWIIFSVTQPGSRPAHFGAGITIDFPTVFAFLDRNHRVIYFQHWSRHLVGLSSRCEGCAAERKTRSSQ